MSKKARLAVAVFGLLGVFAVSVVMSFDGRGAGWFVVGGASYVLALIGANRLGWME